MIGFILYLIVSFSSWGIAHIFHLTKNGITRKIFITFFLALSWETLIRGISFFFPDLIGLDLLTVIIVLPLTLVSAISFVILWFKYRKKEL